MPMKKSTLAVLSMATFAGLAGVATAAPLGIENHGAVVSEAATSKGELGSQTHGSYVSEVARGAGFGSQNIQSNSNSVPVSGSTLILFAAGFVALAVWHRRSRGDWSA
jgi:hypothetical protein